MQTNKTFSPKELAPIIGVSQSSIKRWVDAGHIEVTRTAGGHRRIFLREALHFIQKQKMRVLRPDLLGLPDLEQTSVALPEGPLTGEMLLHVLESDDAIRARGLIAGAFLADQTPAEIFDGPIREAMAELGERWKKDECGIYLEHQATQIMVGAVTQIQMLIPLAEANAPVAVGCAPEQDPYMLPSMMAATVLANIGYREVNLGAHTPASALLEAVERQNADMVWISATSGHAFVDDMHKWESVLKTLIDQGVRVVMGGQAIQRLKTAWPDGVYIMHSMSDLAATGDALRRELLKEGRNLN